MCHVIRGIPVLILLSAWALGGSFNLETWCKRAKQNVLSFWHHLLSKIATVGIVPGVWLPPGGQARQVT